MHNPPVVVVNKPIGITPYQVIEKLKKKSPRYRNSIIGYAGRLDPMAEGLLLLLIDDENKKRKEYEKLSKEYEFVVLLGISSDSYDLLGIPKEGKEMQLSQAELKEYIDSLSGTFNQEYPPYSSARVKGKPLFWWARNNKIKKITVPQKEVTITSAVLLNMTSISKNQLQETVFERISKVDGEFRQELIRKAWGEYFKRTKIQKYPLLQCKISCSSGLYVRSIANELGVRFKTGALAFSIKRTKIGGFMLG